jgi:molybdopterin molybdotransferase
MPLFTRPKDDVQPEVEVIPPPVPRHLADSTDLIGSGVRSLDAHRDFLLSQVNSLHPFGIGLLDAAGLTLCESIVADLDLPTFTSATTDGWAVRTANLVGASPDLPVILPVVDAIEAGGYRGAPLTKGTAVRVAAGAPVPDGADAVMPTAAGLAVGDEVQFTSEARVHQNLRLLGSRISDGDELVAKGTVLTPRTLGVIAEVGHDKVLARPRPRVVVLTADSTLVEPGLPLTRLAESYDACTTMLAATARLDGARVFPGGIVSAEPRTLVTTLGEQLIRSDLVLLVTEVTDELIGIFGEQDAIDVTELDALAGRQLFALVGPDQVPVLVLPPGAVPAYLTYLLLGRPLVQRLAGAPDAPTQEVSAPVTVELLPDPSGTRLLLARLTDRGVSPLGIDDPGAAGLAAANAVIVLPPGAEPVPAHGDVTCWLLD